MLRRHIGNPIERRLVPLARFLDARRIRPSALTLTGLGVSLAAGACYARGWAVAAGCVVILAGLCDMLDGAVARVSGRVSRTGGFMDSVIDRYSDAALFGGILLRYTAEGDGAGTGLALAVLTGAYLVSYVRARAELVIPKCDVGLMERPERLVVLVAGSLSGLLVPALWVLALTSHATALHRILYTLRRGA